MAPQQTRRAAAAAAVAIAAIGATPSVARAEAAWPRAVNAHYKVSFAGVSIGGFVFRSKLSGRDYLLEGHAKLSIGFGLLRWEGRAQSSGKLKADVPDPTTYGLDYRRNKKAASVKMAFARDRVSSLQIEPPSYQHPDKVPVTGDHTRNVLDPLSAILAVSKVPAGQNPCDRKVPVFDGKQRFDLAFEMLRRQTITDSRPNGTPSVGYVCRVRYKPIAGHRIDKATTNLAARSDITVLLRPVPAAGLFVPVSVTVPTMAGTATLTSNLVDITTASNQRIALQH